MIIWINGSFGSGKTSVSLELSRLIANSHIYDPEEVGFLIRDNIPADLMKDDFQDYDLWREFNYGLLKFIAKEYAGPIIVPMTIHNKNYLNDIIGNLRSDNFEVKHFTLIAGKDTLVDRLNGRGDDNNEWVHSRVEECVSRFNDKEFEGKINTENCSILDIAKQIFKECGLAKSIT